MMQPDEKPDNRAELPEKDETAAGAAECKGEMTYEEALAALEAVVARLESGDVALDEAMKLFQQGTELSRICTARLAAIEKQINLLLQKDDGTIEEKPFDEEN